MTEAPYNANPELSAMKQDIAERNYRITMKSMLIAGGVALAAIATGGIAGALLVGGTEAVGAGIILGFGAGVMGGAALSSVATMKDRAKLKIDEDMVQSYMSGKNYWGEGYREEVAERGYGFGQQQLPAARESGIGRG